MPRTARTTPTGRQLAIAVPRDAWTGVGLAVTPDEDGDQTDLFEQIAAEHHIDDAAVQFLTRR